MANKATPTTTTLNDLRDEMTRRAVKYLEMNYPDSKYSLESGTLTLTFRHAYRRATALPAETIDIEQEFDIDGAEDPNVDAGDFGGLVTVRSWDAEGSHDAIDNIDLRDFGTEA